MLILVGVTVTVALKGGLFESANESTRQKEEKTIYEQIVGAMKLKDTGKTDVTGTYNAAKTDLELQGKTVTPTSPAESEITDATASITFKVKGKKGTYTYTITTEEIKIEREVPEDLATYILGTDRTGRDLVSEMSANGILSMSTMIFEQDPLNLSSTVYQDVKWAYVGDDYETIYIRYGRDVYSFKMTMVVDDNDTPDDDSDDTENYLTVANSLKYERTPEGNLGKYVQYDGKLWIVLYDEGELGEGQGAQIISANATGSVTLGGSTFEEARSSYNSAVSTIISACGGTGSNNIRSIGGPASDTTTTTVDFSELTTFEQSVDDTNFAKYEGENGLIIGDGNYLTDNKDYNKMKEIGILATDTPAAYWLASRFVEERSDDVLFRMRCVYNGGDLHSNYLCYVDSYANADCNPRPYSNAVRPVVTLSSGALGDVAEGVGTRTNPINLD